MPLPKLSSDIDEPTLAQGDVLARKYRLEKPLGEGNMAVVWVAQNMALETQVAVKILRSSLATDPRVVARFRQEAKATAAIAHKNIVQVYDYGVTGWGAPFIVMELLQGETLEQRLKARGPLPPEEAVRILMRVMKGVTVAHSKGVIHRDLKPENIFLAQEENGTERPKVLDFGVSFVVRSSSEDRLTKAGGILGTPSHLPPEAIEGDNHGDARGDVWALGVVLYESLCGELPFRGKTVHALLDAICKEPAPSLLHQVPGVDEELQNILDQSLSKDISERYQGVREFFDDLNAWLSHRDPLPSMVPSQTTDSLPNSWRGGRMDSIFSEDEDGPTLIGPPLDPAGMGATFNEPPSQEKSPSSSREMITRAGPGRDPLPSVPSSSTSPSLPSGAMSPLRSGGIGVGAIVALTLIVGMLFLRASETQEHGLHMQGASSGSVVVVPPSKPLDSAVFTAPPAASPSASTEVEEEAILELLGLPDQALVRVDGHKVGPPPVRLKRGQTVLVRVDAPGYEPWIQEIMVEGSLKFRYTGKPIAVRPPTSTGTNYREVPY